MYSMRRHPEGERDSQINEIGGRRRFRCVTGYPTLDTMIDAKQYGAMAYFRKPLKLSELDSRIRAYLDGEDHLPADGATTAPERALNG